MTQKTESKILLAIATVGAVVAIGITMLGSYAVTQRTEVLKLQAQLEAQQSLQADMGCDRAVARK